MNISATLNGEAVTIVSIVGNGLDVYIAYIDSSTNLKMTKKMRAMSEESVLIATGATIN